jgi:hypothetical protein
VDTDFSRAIDRLPHWIAVLAVCGTVFSLFRFGLPVAGGYLLGSVAAWVNLWLVVRVAKRITTPDSEVRAGGGAGWKLFFQFAALLMGSFVIIYVSGFSKAAAFCGLFVCPAAVMLEMVYELFTLKH